MGRHQVLGGCQPRRGFGYKKPSLRRQEQKPNGKRLRNSWGMNKYDFSRSSGPRSPASALYPPACLRPPVPVDKPAHCLSCRALVTALCLAFVLEHSLLSPLNPVLEPRILVFERDPRKHSVIIFMPHVKKRRPREALDMGKFPQW